MTYVPLVTQYMYMHKISDIPQQLICKLIQCHLGIYGDISVAEIKDKNKHVLNVISYYFSCCHTD